MSSQPTPENPTGECAREKINNKLTVLELMYNNRDEFKPDKFNRITIEIVQLLLEMERERDKD